MSLIPVLVFIAIPLLIWVVIMLLSLRELDGEGNGKPADTTRHYVESPPRFSRDYTGQIWIEKKSKDMLPTIHRRSILPPDQKDDSL